MSAHDLMGAVVVGVVAGFCVFGFITSRAPYWRGYPTLFLQVKDFEGETLHGYRLRYSLRVIYSKVDPAAFRAARMLDENAKDAFVQEFHDRIFLPAFERRSFFAFVEESPELALVLDYNDSGDRIELSRGKAWGLELPEFKEASALIRGCRADRVSVQIHSMDPVLIEENCTMIPEHIRKRIAEDHVGLALMEARCVAGQQAMVPILRRILATRVDTKGDPVRICAHVAVPDGIELNWYKAGHKDSRLIGFRAEGGFPADPYGEEGIRIVDSGEAGGRLLDTVQEGKTYFYTFFLRRRARGGSEVTEPTRFSIAVPLSEDGERIARARREVAVGEALTARAATERRRRQAEGTARDVEEQLTRYRESLTVETEKVQIRRSAVVAELRHRVVAMRLELEQVEALRRSGEIEQDEYEALVEDIRDVFVR